MKLRPLFWTKVPAKQGTIWAEIMAEKALLSETQLTVMEQLFQQAASAVVSAQQPKSGTFLLSGTDSVGFASLAWADCLPFVPTLVI